MKILSTSQRNKLYRNRIEPIIIYRKNLYFKVCILHDTCLNKLLVIFIVIQLSAG